MLHRTRAACVGVVSTSLANGVLYTAYALQLLSSGVGVGYCSVCGVPSPFAVLLLGGVLLRVATLPLTLYSDRRLARMAHAMPSLVDAHTRCDFVMRHPRATSWERQVAYEHLQRERAQVLQRHDTSNARATLPRVFATALTLYALCVPATQLADFLLQQQQHVHTPPLDDATITTTTALCDHLASPLTVSLVGGVLLDVTPALACALSLYNVHQCLAQRRGFSARQDVRVRQLTRLANVVAALIACTATLLTSTTTTAATAATATATATTLAGSASSWAAMLSGVAPVWLGVALTSTAATLLVHHTTYGRAIARVAAYPPTHGQYGSVDTAVYHPLRRMFSDADMAEQRVQWQRQKQLIDYDCSVRLHRLCRRVGMYDDVGELEYEATRMRERREVVQARKQQQQQQHHDDGESGDDNARSSNDKSCAADARRG